MAITKATAGKKPDWNMSVVHRVTGVKGRVGVAWTKPDGSISIKLNPYVTLSGSDPDMFLTLFAYDETYESRRGRGLEQEPGAEVEFSVMKQEVIPF